MEIYLLLFYFFAINCASRLVMYSVMYIFSFLIWIESQRVDSAFSYNDNFFSDVGYGPVCIVVRHLNRTVRRNWRNSKVAGLGNRYLAHFKSEIPSAGVIYKVFSWFHMILWELLDVHLTPD